MKKRVCRELPGMTGLWIPSRFTEQLEIGSLSVRHLCGGDDPQAAIPEPI
jgi:hypothetical protein